MNDAGRRVKFIMDFDYKPNPQTTIAYKAGQVAFVRRECAEKAIARGKAVVVGVPSPPAGIAATIARTARKRTRKRADAGNE